MCEPKRRKWFMIILLPITFVPYIWIYFSLQIDNEQHCMFENVHNNFAKRIDVRNRTDPSSELSTFRRCSKHKIRPFRILVWTSWYGETTKEDDDMFGISSQLCDDLFPVVTWNKEIYDLADVIIFQLADLNTSSELPIRRNPSIPWILAVQETPLNFKFKGKEEFDGVFNWTWSLRSDAEIYGRVQDMLKRRSTPDEDWIYGSNFSMEFMRQKTQMAAWVVSNCIRERSKRTQLALALRKYGVNFTSYGQENPNNNCKEKIPHKPCPGEGESCLRELGRTNKFYFAFENSLCAKFMSEKLSNGLFYSMVPVYYGLADDVRDRAPPNSFIDAMDFNTTEELAKYLIHLDSHDAEYFKYFEWRQNYSVDISDPMAIKNSYHCSIWKKMRELTEKSKISGRSHTYDKLDEWLNSFYNSHLETPSTCDICLEGKEISYKRPRHNRMYFHSNLTRCIKEPQIKFEEANGMDIEWVE